MDKKALKIRRRTLGKHHQDVALGLYHIGVVLLEQGKYDDAVEMLDKALSSQVSTFTRALGIDNIQNAQAHYQIAFASSIAGDRAGALASAREAVRIFNKHGVTDAQSQGAVDLLRILEGGA
jgi:tetratricopeptide (TPR) repeat protein